MPRWLICFFLLTCIACSTKPVIQKPTATVLDSSRVSFKGAILDHNALQQLKQETLSREEWINVLPVIALSTDTGMLANGETQVAGNYTVDDSAIVFTAATPFIKHTQYVARFYASDSGLSYIKMAQGKTNLSGPGQTEFRFKIN
jgi:hypothetical protein